MGKPRKGRGKAKGEARARVAHAHVLANPGKLSALATLRAAYGRYVQTCIDRMVAGRRFHVDEKERQAFFPKAEELTSQLQKCARAQAVGMVSGWATALYTRLRNRIGDKALAFTEEERVQLYTIGKHLVTKPGTFGKGTISQKMLDLYWSWVWDPEVTGERPHFGEHGKMWLSEMCVRFGPAEKASGLGGWWIAVSCLKAGSRVKIPLAMHPSLARGAKLAKSVLVGQRRDGRWTFQFTERDVAEIPAATSDKKVAIDVGLNVLAALSDGRRLGEGHKKRFNRLYEQIRSIRSNRFRQGLRENSGRLDRMEARLSGLTKTAAGTVVNQILRLYPGHTFVLEDLDLRGCRGQKRFAYRAVQENLARKAPVEHKNPAYTSQECISCHYVHRGNRHGTLFQCRGCGRISHADNAASRNLLGRSEDQQITRDTDVKTVRAILRTRYRLRRRDSAGDRCPRRTVRPVRLLSQPGGTASNLAVRQ